MSRSSAIPATVSAEFNLAASRWQRRFLLLSHLSVPLLLLPNRPPWLVFALICSLLGLHGYWQWRVLARRVGRVRIDNSGLYLLGGDGGAQPVTGKVRYLSRWLLVLELASEAGRQRLALWRDGYSPEQWRQLQVLAREHLRAGEA